MSKHISKKLSSLSDGKRDTLTQTVFHRFIRFEVGLNLIKRDEPTRINLFKSVESGQGSKWNVPVNYLNSLEHINDPLFLPDLSHTPTLDKILLSVWGDDYRYEYAKCEVFKEEGFRVISDEGSVSPLFPTKGEALIWSICMICPF